MKRLNFLIVFLAIFSVLGPAPALAGTTTLVTYYPAPNGNYSKVTLYPQAQPSGVCRSGAMYVDNTTGAFNYCVDSNINPNGGGLIGGVLAGTGAWGNLQTVNPVHYYDVANKGYVDAAGNTGYPGVGMDMLNAYFAQQGFFTPHTNTCSGGEVFVAIAGSVGYCIESSARAGSIWVTAKESCAAAGKRLPEPWEWQYACVNNVGGVAASMTSWEWASNFTVPMYTNNPWGVGVGVPRMVFNSGSCGWGAFGMVTNGNPAAADTYLFRCVH